MQVESPDLFNLAGKIEASIKRQGRELYFRRNYEGQYQKKYSIAELLIVELNKLIQVPILDGSAREWVEAVEEAGLKVALDRNGKSCEKLAPVLREPVTVWKNDSFIAAFPYSTVKITYGIDFPQAPEIGCQWFSSTCLDKDFFSKELASARTFCIYEQVEQLCKSGVIKGGSAENAIVCSESRGWLNPPLRFSDEPCRHKVLDLIGDLSLLAHGGNQGLPVAHIIVYKGGHALHADFARCLSRIN
ncbi:probable UDP-3-O-acyl-N-acetylglucosamine deacetylase 1, mitochondrial [Lycium ferocissimum]|uniref:probable UDP-3-O-acyl-N-acetylglucosamine deacetylase 1, mitochondrial n=1 Tax=Lycium ferocissimum TaxID=112874 RepID=UPI0028169950|nr:probable UDP-3-O-acyl-N-acetylglucosamine deacetylase 1, mitochondrial [Lycium ferocissimum]